MDAILTAGRFLSEVEYDGHLSGIAYIILIVVLFGIFGGLGWCFYKAISTGSEQAPIQHHDEIGDENKVKK